MFNIIMLGVFFFKQSPFLSPFTAALGGADPLAVFIPYKRKWATALTRLILRNPGRIGHPTMCFVPGIDRFLLTYSTDSAPHTFNTDPAE